MLTATKTSPKEQAQRFVNAAKASGWVINACDNVVTIQKNFIPGDRLAYSDCDSEAYSILALVPLKGGSVWGTDGGSVGGHVGLEGGYYRLNKSGNNGKRFVAAVNTII